MPTVGRDGPYRFFFFSADCREPAHVHVQRGELLAKVWLHDLRIADAGRFTPTELGRIMAAVRNRQAAFRERWDEHCGG